jgi:hypothetical protein
MKIIGRPPDARGQAFPPSAGFPPNQLDASLHDEPGRRGLRERTRGVGMSDSYHPLLKEWWLGMEGRVRGTITPALGGTPIRSAGLSLTAAGRAGDEVLRNFGEKIEFRARERIELGCESGIGKPLAQLRNGSLVLCKRESHSGNVKPGIAEEAMDHHAELLARFKIFQDGGIAG